MVISDFKVFIALGLPFPQVHLSVFFLLLLLLLFFYLVCNLGGGGGAQQAYSLSSNTSCGISTGTR